MAEIPWSVDPEDPTIISVKEPNFILPVCGGKNEVDDLGDIRPRTCCNCYNTWECDMHTCINGRCPHYGAVGPNPKSSRHTTFRPKFKEDLKKSRLRRKKV